MEQHVTERKSKEDGKRDTMMKKIWRNRGIKTEIGKRVAGRPEEAISQINFPINVQIEIEPREEKGSEQTKYHTPITKEVKK